MTPETILVAMATDVHGDELVPSATDCGALAQAQDLAARTGATLRILHCIDFFDDKLAPGRLVHDQIRKTLNPRLEALCQAAAAVEVEASHVIRCGVAHREIIAEAEAIHADVIVASPRRHSISFGDRLRHGSTSRRLLRRATCDVWIVEPCSKSPPRRLLALLDLSEASVGVIGVANMLAAVVECDRLAIHCLTHPDDMALQRLPAARGALERYHRDISDEARRKLEHMTGGNEAGWGTRLSDEWVVRAVPQCVGREDVDIVVVARAAGADTLGEMGSTAERLVDRMAVSTWVTRQRGRPR